MSNYTKATNFLAKDSLADADPLKIIKGADFDTEFNALQVAVNTKANTISPTFTGTPLAPTATAATNTTQLATTEFVTTAVTAAMPSGAILLWSGSAATIPTGWLLCNGSNSTPDLRNRFVVVTDPGHFHTGGAAQYYVGDNGSHGYVTSTTNTGTAVTGITVANSTEGVSGTNANLPPYFALCYIMKS